MAIDTKNSSEESLSNAIEKFNLSDDIITYRGTCAKYYKDYNVGDIFKEKVFYSTSVNYEQAKSFADDATECRDENDGYGGILLEIKVPKGSKALYIGANTDYKSDGYVVNEYELLLACKTKYKVIDIEKDRIILEVINIEN